MSCVQLRLPHFLAKFFPCIPIYTKIENGEGMILNGKKEGIWTFKDDNGKIRKYITFQNGVKYGAFVEIGENGNIINQGEINSTEEQNDDDWITV